MCDQCEGVQAVASLHTRVSVRQVDDLGVVEGGGGLALGQNCRMSCGQQDELTRVELGFVPGGVHYGHIKELCGWFLPLKICKGHDTMLN